MLLNPVAGLQIYVAAPLTVKIVDWPLQIVTLGETVSEIPLIETVTCAVAVQPFKLPVTVYVVVDAGNA